MSFIINCNLLQEPVVSPKSEYSMATAVWAVFAREELHLFWNVA